MDSHLWAPQLLGQVIIFPQGSLLIQNKQGELAAVNTQGHSVGKKKVFAGLGDAAARNS